MNETITHHGLLAPERQNLLLKRLETLGQLRVTEIALELGVTEETIRRDLGKLDKLGKLQRTHGGAIACKGTMRELPLEDRLGQSSVRKQAIAFATPLDLPSGSVIAIDASSTCLALLAHLPDIELTLITYSLQVALLATGHPWRVILIGGEVDADSQSCIGPHAESMIRRYNIHTAFLSARGIDAKRGLSDGNEMQAMMKRAMIESAQHVCFLADETKLGARSRYFFAELNDVDLFVTDASPENPLLQEITKAVGQLVSVS